MNPLSEMPHLFANGKFKAKVVTGEKEHQKLKPRTIIGLKRTLRDWLILQTLKTDKVGTFEIEYCTLIARPIEDMTDEEIDSLWPNNSLSTVNRLKKEIFGRDKDRQALIELANEDMLLFKEARKLSSLGVYPGPQSHFGDTVIDTRTLKTNA